MRHEVGLVSFLLRPTIWRPFFVAFFFPSRDHLRCAVEDLVYGLHRVYQRQYNGETLQTGVVVFAWE